MTRNNIVYVGRREIFFGLAWIAVALGGGCVGVRQAPEAPVAWEVQSDYIRVDDTLVPDARIQAYVLPFTEKLMEEMNRPLGTSLAVLPIGQPESPLGNLVADLVKKHTRESVGHDVDIALINWRGLRIPLPEGTITVGTIYELMPFENYFTLLQYDGRQLAQLLDEVAAYGGEPVSGVRMKLWRTAAMDVTVNGEPIDPDRLYWIVTNNWMADGGGEMPTLWDYRERIDTGVLIRDALIEEFDSLDPIHAEIEGRMILVDDDH